MAYGFTYTLPTLLASHSGFVVVLKTADFPADALNSANQFDNGGGNLVAYTDSSKTTQLPVHVVELVTGASASAEVRVRLPTASSGSTIYLEADTVQTAQPAASSTYGYNNVYQDYLFYTLCRSTEDLTGNGATLSTGTATQTDDYYEFNGSTNKLVGTLSTTIEESLTVQTICEADVTDSNHRRAITLSDISQVDSRCGLSQYGSLNYSRINTNSFGDNTVLDGATVGTSKRWLCGVEAGSYRRLILDGSQTGYSTDYVNPINFDFDTVTLGAWSSSSGTYDFWSGKVYLGSVRLGELSTNFISDEYDNQSAATAWGTVGSWADSGSGTSIAPAADTISIAGNTVTVTAAVNIAPTLATLSIAGQTVTVTPSTSITPSIASLSVAGLTATLSAAANISVASTSMSIAGDTVSITNGEVLLPAVGTAVISGQNITVAAQYIIDVAAGTLSIAGQTVSIDTTREITVGEAALIIDGQEVTVSAVFVPTLDGNQVILPIITSVIQSNIM